MAEKLDERALAAVGLWDLQECACGHEVCGECQPLGCAAHNNDPCDICYPPDVPRDLL